MIRRLVQAAKIRTGVGLPKLVSAHSGHEGARNAEVLNRVIGCVGATSYLEIGVENGRTFAAIECARKHGVDPIRRFSLKGCDPGTEFFHGTSDEFFATVLPDVSFDVIFIDGLHTYSQSLSDLKHAFMHLRAGTGVILLDDVVPCNEAASRPVQEVSPWMGDVYKTVFQVHHNCSDQGVTWQTIEVAPARYQTWLQGRFPGEQNLSPSKEFDSVQFADAFSDGVPGFFNLTTLDEALLSLRLDDF